MNIVLLFIYATLKLGPLIYAQSCSQGSFGRDCALQCHCRDNSCLNDEKSEGCQSGTCSPGYTGFPGCQKVCPQGSFGVDCEGRCHCAPFNHCLHTNGNCEKPNRCVPERTGPSCQILRPRLDDPPSVTVNCTTVTVSWRGSKKRGKQEASDIRQYRIEVCEGHSDAFVEARTVESYINTSEYTESFEGHRPDSMVTFRVVPVFFVDTGSGDGYLEDGIPSPPSKRVKIPIDEAVVGPKNCALIGLGQTWAIFTFRPSQTSCHLGSLLGYELSTTSMDSEAVVQRFLVDITATVILASDLSPGTEYKAEVLARFQKGNVRCLNSPLRSFKTPEPGFYSVEIQTRERRYDNLAFQLTTNSSQVQPKEYYVVSSAVKSQLTIQAGAEVWSFLRVQSAPFHLTLTNLQPATEYRVYAWAPPVEGTDFQGTSADIWTSPKPFATSPNFRIDPHLMSEPSDTSVVLLYPNVSGYTGGLITDYYLAISPGHVGIEIAPVASSATPMDHHLPMLRRQLSLPPSAHIVHHSHDLPTDPIIVGDGVVSTGGAGSQDSNELFSDPPLKPSSPYTLFVVVQSAVEASAETSPTQTFFFNTLPSRTSARTQILVAAVLVLLFALIIFLLAYFCYRRHKRQESSKVLNNYFSFRPNRDIKEVSTAEDAKLDALPKSYAAWSLSSGKRDPRFLIIDPTKGPDSTLLGTKSIDEIAASFKREFDSLPTGRILPHSAGMKPLNRYKNRSEQSLPYDHSRVKLKRSLNSPENDYINASFVDGYMRRKAYIAAQSPFNATTATDFWVMVFQCNVSQIVMLSNRIEGGAVCCTKYWPEVDRERAYDEAICASDNTNVERQYDSLLVLALDSTEYASFTVRRFQISDLTSGAVQLVSQYHFHDWQPRRFLPSARWHRRGSQADRVHTRAAAAEELADFDYLAFIDFYFHVVTARRPEDGPLLVHCEEGVSRTSVFLAFDMLLQQFLTEHSVSVARLCAGMRRARPNMVPTPRHYALLYDLLYEAGIGGQSLIDLNVRSVLKSLIRRNPALGITYLTEQWYLLHNFTPPLDRRTDSLAALASVNVAKNRFPNILDLLPPDRFRPRLPPNYHSLDLPADYINAVYLDTVGLRDDLILTQTPLRSTVLDFWRMVFEERVSCIVDVEPSCYGSEDAVRYWPVSQADHQDSLISEDLADFHATTYPFDLADAEIVEALGVLTDETSQSPSAAAALGPWFQFGDFQLCQVGDLSPVLSSPPGSESKSKQRSCIFRRRLIIRKVDKSSLAKPPDSRTVQVFHFKGRWKEEGQIPASRAQFLRLLEVVRLERGLGPAVIHCLDGGTRSGLFAASYVLVERITRDLFVDVFHTIKAMKLRRRAVIGSAVQLRFLYRVLIDWVDMTIEKPLRRQQISYPITFVRDPLLSTIHDAHSSGLLSSTTSHLSLASMGDSSTCLPRGEEAVGVNMSNSMSAVYHQPRRNVVLYRYFTEELSKLMRNGRTSLSPAADAAGLGSRTVGCTTSSPRRKSKVRVSQGDLVV